MVCKNGGIYGFLPTSWVLITMAVALVIGGARFETRGGKDTAAGVEYSRLYIFIRDCN